MITVLLSLPACPPHYGHWDWYGAYGGSLSAGLSRPCSKIALRCERVCDRGAQPGKVWPISNDLEEDELFREWADGWIPSPVQAVHRDYFNRWLISHLYILRGRFSRCRYQQRRLQPLPWWPRVCRHYPEGRTSYWERRLSRANLPGFQRELLRQRPKRGEKESKLYSFPIPTV